MRLLGLLCCRGQDLGESFEVQRLIHRNGESYRFILLRKITIAAEINNVMDLFIFNLELTK